MKLVRYFYFSVAMMLASSQPHAQNNDADNIQSQHHQLMRQRVQLSDGVYAAQSGWFDGNPRCFPSQDVII